jgi:hypothetical protein
MKLYHITPSWRVASIFVEGLCPGLSANDADRTWFCTKKQLPWALRHLSDLKKIQPASFVILEVRIARDDLVRRRPGIYWTAKNVSADKVKIYAPNAAAAIAERGNFAYWRPSPAK